MRRKQALRRINSEFITGWNMEHSLLALPLAESALLYSVVIG